MQFLLREGADVPLRDLPVEHQTELTRQMGALRAVDRATVRAVMREFAEALDGVGLDFPRGTAGALTALLDHLHPDAARDLRREAGAQSGDPFAILVDLPREDLTALARSESAEIAAVLISKLPTALAARILQDLPGDHARRIAYAVSLTAEITPAAVVRIGQALLSQVESAAQSAFDGTPEFRMGAILNATQGATRDAVLQDLDARDATFAQGVRESIFVYANIPDRIAPKDVPKITRDIDQSVLVDAFAGATTPADARATEFILSNISTRLSAMLRDEVEERGQVQPDKADDATSEIVRALIRMSDAKEIEMLPVRKG